MTGNVANLHLLLMVPLQLPSQPDLALEFVIDTGFTGFLALPPAAVAALGLPLLHSIVADLADGSTIRLAVHEATILWNGAQHQVRVLATGQRPLLGTALLDGYELIAQFTDGGLVTVERL
jgi:clan AA aspartic protease